MANAPASALNVIPNDMEDQQKQQNQDSATQSGNGGRNASEDNDGEGWFHL